MIHTPIFQSIFGTSWDNLPPVMHKHYANRPFSRDKVTVEGLMDVQLSYLAKLFSPLMRITGLLVPYSGKNIPVTVHFTSSRHNHSFTFERIFHFDGKTPYHFHSTMIPTHDNHIIEWMACHLGWCASYHLKDNNVILHHEGYALRLFNKTLRLPLSWFVGRGYAEETAIDAHSFSMCMELRHPIFGRLYAYSGTFTIKEVQQHD